MNIELLVLSAAGFEREKDLVSPHAEPHRRPIPASHNPEHQDFFCVDGRPSPVVATRRALGFLRATRSRRERRVDVNAIDRFGLVVPPSACTGTLFGRGSPSNPIGGASSRKVFECTHFLRALALRSCASDFGPQVSRYIARSQNVCDERAAGGGGHSVVRPAKKRNRLWIAVAARCRRSNVLSKRCECSRRALSMSDMSSQ